MEKYLRGWKSIEKYLCLSRHAIIKRGYPVRRQPGSGVWADPGALDAHTAHLFTGSALLCDVSKSRQRTG